MNMNLMNVKFILVSMILNTPTERHKRVPNVHMHQLANQLHKTQIGSVCHLFHCGKMLFIKIKGINKSSALNIMGSREVVRSEKDRYFTINDIYNSKLVNKRSRTTQNNKIEEFLLWLANGVIWPNN